MIPEVRERASDKAAQWRMMDGVALGKVEETRLTLRRVGALVAWLEEQWLEERARRIQLERELALRSATGLHSGLSVADLTERLRGYLAIALEREPGKLELAIALLARPEVDRAVRDTLAICLRWIRNDADRVHAREAVEREVVK